MAFAIKPFKYIVIFCAVFICVFTLLFNVYYLFHSHQQILIDYFSLNSCFYKSSTFAVNFFTENTKSQGNYFAVISLMLVSVMLLILFKKSKVLRFEPTLNLTVKLPEGSLIYLISIAVISICAWVYGFNNFPPAYDEVFSADKAAGLPFFQTLSYYMLPNNHIGFNLFNKLVFYWVDDKVISGRILSLLVYICWNCLCFLVFLRMSQSKSIAFLTALVLAFSFPIWGFAFEARGYELSGFCEFVAFISLYAYFNSNNKNYLWLNTLSSLIAYVCLPTFLYFQFAFILFGIWKAISTKTIDKTFWMHQFFVVVGAFFFYLPSLSYSGIAAFTHNKYMQSENIGTLTYLVQTVKGLSSYYNYALSDLAIKRISVGFIFGCLPLIALISKKIKHRELFILYVFMLLATFVIMILMRRNPYHRNLNGHFYIMLFLGIYIFFSEIKLIDSYIKIKKISFHLMRIYLVLLLVNFILINTKLFNYKLYFDDINYAKTKTLQELEFVTPQSTLSCSDGGFFHAYYAKKKKVIVEPCGLNKSEFYLILSDEPKPEDLLKNYELYKQVNDCDVYRLKY